MHLELLFKFALKALIVGAASAAKPKYIAAVSTPHPTCRVVDCLTLLKAAPASGRIIVVFHANQNPAGMLEQFARIDRLPGNGFFKRLCQPARSYKGMLRASFSAVRKPLAC